MSKYESRPVELPFDFKGTEKRHINKLNLAIKHFDTAVDTRPDRCKEETSNRGLLWIQI